MSEYLTHILWRNYEQSISRTLERDRVIQERLREQKRDAERVAAPARPQTVARPRVHDRDQETVHSIESDAEEVPESVELLTRELELVRE